MQVSKLLERLAASGSKVQLSELLRSSGVPIVLFPPGVTLCGRVVWLDELEGGAWLGSFECKWNKRSNRKICVSGSGFETHDGAAWLLAWPPIAVWRVTYGGAQYVTFDAVDKSPCGEFDWNTLTWSGDCGEWMIGGESDVLHVMYRNLDVLPPYPLVGTIHRDETFGAYLFLTDPPSFAVGERPPRGRRPRFAIYITAYAEEGSGEEETAEEEVYIYPIPLPDGNFDPADIAAGIVSSIIAPNCRGQRGMSPRVYGMPASERRPSPEPEEEGGDEYDVGDGGSDEEGGDELGELPGEEETGNYEET
jgi:hypothetical protein